MFNILIVEDNLIQSHMLANYISEKFCDVRIYSMVTTGKEAINVIENELVDIIFLDLGLPDISGIEILDFICEKQICKYYQSIIIFTGELDLMAKAIKNESVFDYISKTSEPNVIIRSLENLLQYKGKQKNLDMIKEQINIELQKLQYNFSYAGTKYLAECIYEVCRFDEKYIFNLKKQVYPIVAKKYHKSINNIKTNIARSTSNMYYDCDEQTLKKYFGYNVNKKPNIKEIIEKVIEKI